MIEREISYKSELRDIAERSIGLNGFRTGYKEFNFTFPIPTSVKIGEGIWWGIVEAALPLKYRVFKTGNREPKALGATCTDFVGTIWGPFSIGTALSHESALLGIVAGLGAKVAYNLGANFLSNRVVGRT